MSHHRPAWDRGIPRPPDKTSLRPGGWGESDNSYSRESLAWYFPHLAQVLEGLSPCLQKKKQKKKKRQHTKWDFRSRFPNCYILNPLKDSFACLFSLFVMRYFKVIEDKPPGTDHSASAAVNSKTVSSHLYPPHFPHPIPWVILK